MHACNFMTYSISVMNLWKAKYIKKKKDGCGLQMKYVRALESIFDPLFGNKLVWSCLFLFTLHSCCV